MHPRACQHRSRSTKLVMAYTTPSCMHTALLQLQALISIGLLLASMSSGSAEEAPSGAYGIDATLGDDTKNSPASSSGTFSPVEVVYSEHEYLMKLKMDTWQNPFLGVLDTGSDLVWTKQLDRCNRRAPSTFTFVKCLNRDIGVKCDACFEGLCMFSRTFGGGRKTARGFMGYDTLAPRKNVIFGCAIDNDEELLPKSAQGIVGLNRGPMSLVQQLSLTHFSYCLSNQQSSRLWLGDGDDLDKFKKKNSGKPQMTTPLVHVEVKEDKPVRANRYYVQLEGISIGGNDEYRDLKEGSFDLKSKNDKKKGVMFVDSGCSRTTLEKGVFEALEKLFAEALKKKLFAKELERVVHESTHKKNKKKTCFRPRPPMGSPPFTHSVLPPPPAPSSERPEMVLYFADGAQMRLPWANYTDEEADKSGTLFCLTIREGGESILGNIHQKNTYMLYSLTKGDEKLSFVPDVDCTS